MPPFAGYKDLGDYLERRCRDRGLSYQALSDAIGAGHAYVHAIATGRFAPTAKRLDAIAAYFGDTPKLLRVLAGLETPPTEQDRFISEIVEIAASLSQKARRDLLKYAHYLKSQDQAPA